MNNYKGGDNMAYRRCCRRRRRRGRRRRIRSAFARRAGIRM